MIVNYNNYTSSKQSFIHVLHQDTGTVLLPTDIKYYKEFGGEKVVFEKEEVDEMKKFGKPGIRWLL